MTLAKVRILGWLTIAHGLSHAVLPMRGSLDPTSGDWMPIALFAVATVGFVAAGLGLLGLRPVERVISPLLVLSSAWSLVAIFRHGDPSLWVGAACDAALILVGLWRAFAGWPAFAKASAGRLWHRAAVTAGFILVGYVGLSAFGYPSHRAWGSTRAELAMALPGDAEPRETPFEVQHAVTIDAPAEDVWVWLVQLGQDRAGFYSYDWLERAIGLGVRNVAEVRDEWQGLKAGDFVRGAPPDYLGGLLGEERGWTVTAITPERSLVLEKWGAFVLQPIDDEHTRFIIRSTVGDPDRSVWASAASLFGFQLPHFIMQRRMMLTIKTLAEERWAVRAAEDPVRTIDIVATDDMKYSLNAISAAPGEEIRIRLTAKGVIPKVAMAHNVVVLHLETDIDGLLKEGAPYRETDFIPPAMMKQVIAKTPFAGAGERVQVKFIVPATPGDYPFLCTFAGHYQGGMKGTLSVKAKQLTE